MFLYKPPNLNNRYPLGFRDKEYVSRMKLLNDDYWRTTEKWYYYNVKNQDLIIPTAIVCIIVFFTNQPIIGIIGIISIILIVLYGCHLNNKKLDNDPYVQMCRKKSREEFRRNYMKMDV